MLTFRGRPACSCLVEWLPVYERELRDAGIIRDSIDIYQLIGGNSRSAGTHSEGGAYDIAQWDRRALTIARRMGGAGFGRPYNWDGRKGGAHQHGVLVGCPHNGPARYQIDALNDGYNGLGRGGRGGKDTGPRAGLFPLKTWREGIKWANRGSTTAKDWFDMATPEDLRKVVREELQALFRDDKGAPSIGAARIEDPDGGVTYTLARYLKSILNNTKPKE